ncbi:MAG TPA: tRNA (adenine-N(6)-)-methyltransferase [Prolixibacteraceae bacterium]|jgi:tRNA1Val (adenine37-N6)-methyltransferase|nr:tRNA (adenine-N(6)-)-methyltransferase [Prolixibacteraceae bacterium]
MPRNPYFQFKQFRIVHEQSAMKVGVDGVLLGAWADVEGANRILDIGTGTGLIALMMAQRNLSAMIDAVEIEPSAYKESLFNIRQSPWSERISVECCAFQELASNLDLKYDLIVSNPPFFDNGLKAPLESRAQARHSDGLPLVELISGIAQLLNKNGKAALVLAVESLSELEQLVAVNNLFISRICRVKPNPQKPIFRVLVEISDSECTLLEETLLIEFETHFDYTPEYRHLTKEFYLKF